MSTPEKRKRTVEWDEANLAKNFAERSATMKIDEIETPWHSPPRELFHDLSVEDEGRAPREDVAERERRRKKRGARRRSREGELLYNSLLRYAKRRKAFRWKKSVAVWSCGARS